MNKEEANKWLITNIYFAQKWCEEKGVDPNNLSTYDVEIMKQDKEL